MTSTLAPYLGFRGNAREAMGFYGSVFGGDLTISTFADFQAAQDPAENDLVMHSQLESGAITLMGSDTPERMPFTKGDTISLSLSGEDAEELSDYFDKLAEGGNIIQALQRAPWGASFGMLTDKYGYTWLVNISAPVEPSR